MVSRDPKFTHVLDATGDRWKRLRRISSPSFSARRIKEVSQKNQFENISEIAVSSTLT